MDITNIQDFSSEEGTPEASTEIGVSHNEQITAAKAVLANQLLEEAVTLLERVRHLLGVSSSSTIDFVQATAVDDDADDPEGRVIEGVFDGQKMVGPDGRHYSVPANYASKSKLVEGDLLKLIITPRGAFVFKQIGPTSRRRLLGTLHRNIDDSDWCVKAEGWTYRVLTASVTYFKGRDGDEVSVLVPESGESKWAAVENIIKKT
ncbi:MAG: hypothetical protein WC817_02650 [Patescibacteria group bacterium]|jgi:hypothetical protein